MFVDLEGHDRHLKVIQIVGKHPVIHGRQIIKIFVMGEVRHQFLTLAADKHELPIRPAAEQVFEDLDINPSDVTDSTVPDNGPIFTFQLFKEWDGYIVFTYEVGIIRCIFDDMDVWVQIVRDEVIKSYDEVGMEDIVFEAIRKGIVYFTYQCLEMDQTRHL